MTHECTVDEVLTQLGRDAVARVTAMKTAAPGESGAAAGTAVYLEGDTAMASIPHHEDASVRGKGVIHHPLGGRPEFKGLVDHPDGPMVRIEDGDLVLTIDDLPLLLRWRDTFELAATQLGMRIEALAKHQNGGAA